MFFVVKKLAVLRALARRPPLCPSVFSVFLCVLRNLRFPHVGSPLPSAIFGYAVAAGDSPGFNLRGSSKPPNIQASKLPILRPACASTPPASVPLCLLCVLCVRRNRRFPHAGSLCVPSWFFVDFVIAAQRPASSSPQATARASTSGAPPSLQTSKLPNFHFEREKQGYYPPVCPKFLTIPPRPTPPRLLPTFRPVITFYRLTS